MTENKENTTAKTTDPPAEPKAAPKVKHRTVGNIIYDWGIYGTFAWGVVALASALSAHEAMHGNHKVFNWLRSLNNNCISGLSSFLSSTLLKGKPKALIDGWARGSTMFVTLGMGGWAMMAPIKWLEDNRQSNAAKIDNALGTTPPDPETIEHEPKQTWHSVLSGRLYSWGLSYAAFCLMGPTVTDQLNDKIGEYATQAWMKVRPKAHLPTVKKWANIAAFDALFTVITASATYLWSRQVAKNDEAAEAKSHSAAPMHAANIIIDYPKQTWTKTVVPSAGFAAEGMDNLVEQKVQAEKLFSARHVQRAHSKPPAPETHYTQKISGQPDLSTLSVV